MMIHNNNTPLVVLALLIMTGCAITGMLLGNVGPFNSDVAEAKIPVEQTRGALDSLATQSAFELVQTQQAPSIQQTAMIAQMTSVPLQQTATQVAASDAIQVLQVNATQTAIAENAQNIQFMAQATQTSVANGLYIQNLSNAATATAIVRNQVNEQTINLTRIVIISVGILIIFGWILANIIAKVLTARAQEKLAQGKLLAEQRRLASLRASIQVQKQSQFKHHPNPISLMKKPGDGKGLPKAE